EPIEERAHRPPRVAGATVRASGAPRLVELTNPVCEVGDLHRTQVGDVPSGDLRRPGLGAEPGSFAVGAGAEGDGPLDEAAYVRLHRLHVLGEHGLLDLRDQSLVGQVDALNLDLLRFGV